MSEFMLRALALAKRGEGAVSPNPMVGCVIVKDGKIVGEGFHEICGGPHAEINALRSADTNARGATVYVTLEPCAHVGKTPPCTTALISAGIEQVVAAMRDPNPLVAGKGFEQLIQAGIRVVEGELAEEARLLNEKYLTRIEKKRPWIAAKWAMTLDGKIASKTGSSQWVSSEAARNKVHQLRARADAIMVGSGTALLDDPLLTVRLANPPSGRPPLRIVLDSSASILPESHLVRTARQVPVLIGIDAAAPLENVERLKDAGCEVLVLPGRLRISSDHSTERLRARDFRPGAPHDRSDSHDSGVLEKKAREEIEEFQKSRERLTFLFAELARRDITNLLVEGGGTLLGSLFDAKLLDEVHVFVAPKLIGGKDAISPIAGRGIAEMVDSLALHSQHVETVDSDIYIRGKIR